VFFSVPPPERGQTGFLDALEAQEGGLSGPTFLVKWIGKKNGAFLYGGGEEVYVRMNPGWGQLFPPRSRPAYTNTRF